MARDVWVVECFGPGESEVIGVFSSGRKAVSFLDSRKASPVGGIDGLVVFWKDPDERRYDMTKYELNFLLDEVD